VLVPGAIITKYKKRIILTFSDWSIIVNMKPQKTEIIDGYTIKYHANGKTKFAKGKVLDGQAVGYWEWYRPDGTLKRSGYFNNGEPVGEWITYDQKGAVYKVTYKK